MGKLLAGTAVRDITPTPEILELLKPEGRYSYEGVAHKLYLKTLVLTDGEKKFVYFATDLSRFVVNDETLKRFKDELDIEPGEFIFSTIRTHNTISGFGEDLHNDKTPGSNKYAEFFFDAVIDSCKEAMKNVVPARIGAAEGYSNITCYRECFTPVGNYESVNVNGPQAPWLRVCRVENLEGETLALLVNYSMQSCMVSWYSIEKEGYDLVTNDTAGAIVDYLEKVGKHKYPVFYSNGGGADRQPYMYLMDYCGVNDDGEFEFVHEILPIEASLMIMRLLAAQQGHDVIRTVESIKNYSDDFDFHTEVIYKQVPGKIRPADKIHIYHDGDDVIPVPSKPVNQRLQMSVINGIPFCAANGPVYSGVYKALKEMMPFDVTFFFDDCCGGMGATTIPTPDMEEENKYVHATMQSHNFTARMGYNAFMGGFGKMLEKYMMKKVKTYGGVPYPETED